VSQTSSFPILKARTIQGTQDRAVITMVASTTKADEGHW